MNLITIFKSARPSFLILSPMCVFLGASLAIKNQTSIDTGLLGLILLGGLLAHLSVNLLNEYFDFKSGLDFLTTKTPFNGGSGALPHHPEMATVVLGAGVASLIATLLVGLFIIAKLGFEIAPIGIIGLIIIATYTQWINKHPLICLIAPGTGFGVLMVVGTQFILEGEYRLLPWLVSLVPFFLSNNLLLLNQYPDMEADRKVGRNHFPIAYGIKASNKSYALSVISSILVIVICTLANYLPLLSLITLLPISLAFYSLYGAIKYGSLIGNFTHYLAANVAVAILSPLVLGLSIIFG